MKQANGSPLALEIDGLWVEYNQHTALEDITFSVATGEIVGVIGPNGAGKSTLMKAILGLVRPWRGDISVLGHTNGARQRRIGYIPQLEQVDWDFPVTVTDVALMGRYGRRGPFRRTNREDREVAAASLQKVAMYELKNRLIGELSGGQRRRVLLARALASEPELLLMDEPMAGLDATAQHALLDIIEELRAEGTAILMSTHDLSCVSTCAAKVACLNRRLVAFGNPGEVLTEEVLGETFGTHLLLVHMDGQAYAYQHHAHQGRATLDAHVTGPSGS